VVVDADVLGAEPAVRVAAAMELGQPTAGGEGRGHQRSAIGGGQRAQRAGRRPQHRDELPGHRRPRLHEVGHVTVLPSVIDAAPGGR
jgi:hypothetical protein